MSKRKKSTPKTRSSPDDNELPVWNTEEGNLYWRGRLVLHLATHAHSERAILDKFEKFNWRFVVKNPLPRENADLGDPTSSRRNAIYNLNRHQYDIYFFSASEGIVAWCPAEWLAE
jgi:hypothetical protein